ncbi:hypothetical protein FOL47_007097 [Perkinsus chesapeaki]|uniref:Vesicle transport protein n=1 Tax=Perkinsus chesapeaki TaxID=330153 RepID=A0A7J6LMP4_PERCH|nr:hypothetical protein FOL47_007097 [Perkinsus chesapeaki]
MQAASESTVSRGWWPNFSLPQLSANPSESTEVDDDDGIITYLCPDLTLKQRTYDWQQPDSDQVIGWAVCFSFGLLVTVASMGSLKWLVLGKPLRFALTYTIGNLCELASTVFLVGPARQWRNMSQKHRAWAAIIYVTAMVATLLVCFRWPEERLLVVVLVLAQCCAVIWYSLSYIPYGRHLARTDNCSLFQEVDLRRIYSDLLAHLRFILSSLQNPLCLSIAVRGPMASMRTSSFALHHRQAVVMGHARGISTLKIKFQKWLDDSEEGEKKPLSERWKDRMNRAYRWFDEPKHTPIGAGFWWLLTHDVKTFYKWDSALRLVVFSSVLYYIYSAYKNLKFKRSERIPETPQQRMQRHHDERTARKETAVLHNSYQNQMLQVEWRDASEERISRVMEQIKREEDLLKEWEVVEVGDEEVEEERHERP